jgi:adenylyltransferase/sulfurtransferase
MDGEGGEITATELKGMMDAGETFTLIDVRQPSEFQICKLPKAQLLPLGVLPKALHRFDSSETLICYCHHGVRSALALDVFRSAGFENVQHLRGGIHAWSQEVDPRVPVY